MERLIKKLSELQGEQYKGSYIGKVVWEKSRLDLPQQAEAHLSIQRASRKFMRIQLVLESCHKVAASLTVTLFLAEENQGAAAPVSTRMLPKQKPSGQMVFTAAEIAAFVRTAGDDNPIHGTAQPVVPGLLILQWLQAELPTAAGISIRFLQPLYGGDAVSLYKMSSLWQACGPQGLAFQAEIQYFTNLEE